MACPAILPLWAEPIPADRELSDSPYRSLGVDTPTRHDRNEPVAALLAALQCCMRYPFLRPSTKGSRTTKATANRARQYLHRQPLVTQSSESLSSDYSMYLKGIQCSACSAKHTGAAPRRGGRMIGAMTPTDEVTTAVPDFGEVPLEAIPSAPAVALDTLVQRVTRGRPVVPARHVAFGSAI
jgi:hypothetical protein